MKIRSLLLGLVVSLGLFVSCDSIGDALSVDVDTKFKVDVPLESDGTSFVFKSAPLEVNFGGSETLDLKTNADVKSYIDNLKSVSANDATVQIAGLKDGQVINNVTVSVQIGDKTATYSGSNITSATESVSVPEFISLVNGWDITKIHEVTVTVSGNSNEPFQVGVVKGKVIIPAKVKASALKN